MTALDLAWRRIFSAAVDARGDDFDLEARHVNRAVLVAEDAESVTVSVERHAHLLGRTTLGTRSSLFRREVFTFRAAKSTPTLDLVEHVVGAVEWDAALLAEEELFSRYDEAGLDVVADVELHLGQGRRTAARLAASCEAVVASWDVFELYFEDDPASVVAVEERATINAQVRAAAAPRLAARYRAARGGATA